MKSLLKLSIFLLLSAAVVYAQPYPFGRADQHDILPVITDIVPDSNFTVMSYSLPNNPQCQLINGNHLYLAAGVFLQIYELREDGLPMLTGQVRTPDLIRDIDHDGQYVYVANGYRGLTIYDGNDYENPGLFSHTVFYGVTRILASGDTLFANFTDSLAIINIADRSNPVVERVIDRSEIMWRTSSSNDFFRFNDYLITLAVLPPIQREYICSFDLTSPDSIPQVVDTVDVTLDVLRGMKLYENRLYVFRSNPQTSDDYLYIYEIGPTGHINQRCAMNLAEGRLGGYHSGITEAIIDDSRIGFLGIADFYPDGDSLYTSIHAIQLDNLSNPVFIDSTEPNTATQFGDLCQYGLNTYGIGDHHQYGSTKPGAFAYSWTPSFESELIYYETQYSYCLSVEARDDLAYAGTTTGELYALDVSDKTNPQVMSEISDLSRVSQMEIVNDRLYLLSSSRFFIYDITDPYAPEELGVLSLDSGCGAINFQLHENVVYITYFAGIPNGYGYLLIADIADPHNIFIYSDESYATNQKPSVLDYPLIFLLEGHGFVEIVDVSNPYNPDQLETIDLNFGPAFGATWRQTWHHYLYLFGGRTEVWDITNPYTPNLLWGESDTKKNVFESNNVLFMSDYFYGVYAWDLEISPTERQDVGYFHNTVAGNLSVDYPYIYIPGRDYGLVILRFDDPTGIDDELLSLPKNNGIISAYPNPFNSTVSFQIQTDSESSDNLRVFDIAGRLVCDINLPKNEADYTIVQWDGKNNQGDDVGSGVYFAKYGNSEKQETLKVVLLR